MGRTTFGARQASCSESGQREAGRGASQPGWRSSQPHPPARSLVAFHPDPARLLLFSSAADTSVRMWSLQERSCLAVLTAHYSAVTSLTFSADGHTMLRSEPSPPPGLGREGRPTTAARALRRVSPQLGPGQDLCRLGPAEPPGHKDCAGV